VITIRPTFEGLLAESFDQIRGSARGNVTIMLRMLGALQTIAGRTARLGRRRTLRDQVRWIAELAERTIEFAQTVRGSTRGWRACEKRSIPILFHAQGKRRETENG